MINPNVGRLLYRGRRIVNLALIAAACYVVASTGNAVLAFNLRRPGVAPPPTDRPPARSPERPHPLAAIAERNLLAARRDPPPDRGTLPPPATVTGTHFDDGKLRPCTLTSELRATLVARSPKWSSAVIYDRTKRESTVYALHEGENEIGHDAVLVDIRRHEVVVRRADHFELCAVDSKKPSRSAARRAPTTTASASVAGVTKVAEDKWVVTREEVDASLANLSRVATQARIVPSFKNGKPNGFKLFSIKPSSIYKKVGLKNGDIVRKINGYEMDSPDKALEIYQKLKDANSVSLEIQRRGQSKHFTYSIE